MSKNYSNVNIQITNLINKWQATHSTLTILTYNPSSTEDRSAKTSHKKTHLDRGLDSKSKTGYQLTHLCLKAPHKRTKVKMFKKMEVLDSIICSKIHLEL